MKILESYFDKYGNKTHAKIETAWGTEWFWISGYAPESEILSILDYTIRRYFDADGYSIPGCECPELVVY